MQAYVGHIDDCLNILKKMEALAKKMDFLHHTRDFIEKLKNDFVIKNEELGAEIERSDEAFIEFEHIIEIIREDNHDEL